MDDTPEFGESEWNAAAYRIRYISKLCVEVRKAYGQAINTDEPGDIRQYFNMVDIWYQELRRYLDEDMCDRLDDKIDTLRQNTDNDQNDATVINQLEKIRELDQKLGDLQLQLGIDIPSKQQLDPDSALIDGHMG